MKRHYDGLEAVKIRLENTDIATTSSCVAMIQLEMVGGVCVTDKDFQQIEYVGDQG